MTSATPCFALIRYMPFKRIFTKTAILTGLLFSLVACRETVAFTTKTGIALDLDAQPTSLDFGFIRSEGTIAPIFEGGEVLPVMSTVGSGLNGIGIASDHSFATGDSSIILADALLQPGRYILDGSKPVKVSDLSGVIRVPKSAERSVYFFGTDTSLGMHVQWTAATLPTGLSIGWKRKELALVPLMESTEWVLVTSSPRRAFTDEVLANVSASNRYIHPVSGAIAANQLTGELTVAVLKDQLYLQEYDSFKLASLLATASGSATPGSDPESTKGAIGQTFATGAAATLLVTHEAVRRVVSTSLVPEIVRAQEGIDPLTASLSDISLLASIGNFIKAKDQDPAAISIASKLDAIHSEFDFANNGFKVFQSYTSIGNKLIVFSAVAPPVTNFAGVIGYVSRLKKSIHAIEIARAANLNGHINEDTSGAIVARAFDFFDPELQKQRAILADLSTVMRNSGTIRKAVAYVTSTLQR